MREKIIVCIYSLLLCVCCEVKQKLPIYATPICPGHVPILGGGLPSPSSHQLNQEWTGSSVFLHTNQRTPERNNIFAEARKRNTKEGGKKRRMEDKQKE